MPAFTTLTGGTTMKPILPTLLYATLAAVAPFAASTIAEAASGKVVVVYQTGELPSLVAIAKGDFAKRRWWCATAPASKSRRT